MKRIYGVFLPAVVLSSALIAPPTVAHAATTSLTVVGTSDVYDSHLVQDVIKPGFEAAYPQYTVTCVSKGTGAAIAYAKAGTADAMLVHAASLENQFVGDGYSLESAGRAIFWGDYVLLGPKSDPVGVKAAASHDIVKAFELVAAAGAAGTANFVSRGGTPGTTVQEHLIWSQSTGTTLCAVSATDGGGSSPSTATGNCASPISIPAWYHATGLTQGPNIIAGDTCSFTGGNCYVLTDRGTFAYLQSTGQAQNLQIVTRDNAATATGGITMLVNSFHAYAINPAKFPGVTINSVGATALLDWITSVDGQKKIGGFLPADPPFIPDAAPAVSVGAPAATVAAGSPVTIKATLTNVVPGTPVLNDVPVKLLAQPSTGAATTVATATTDAHGTATFSYSPSVNATYTVVTDRITKVEDATLSPVFTDFLAPTSTPVGSVSVNATVKVRSAKAKGHRKVNVKGAVAPAVTGSSAVLKFYAAKSGKKLKLVSTRKLTAGQSTFSYTFTLAKKGKSKYRLSYVNDGVVSAVTTATAKVTIR